MLLVRLCGGVVNGDEGEEESNGTHTSDPFR